MESSILGERWPAPGGRILSVKQAYCMWLWDKPQTPMQSEGPALSPGGSAAICPFSAVVLREERGNLFFPLAHNRPMGQSCSGRTRSGLQAWFQLLSSSHPSPQHPPPWHQCEKTSFYLGVSGPTKLHTNTPSSSLPWYIKSSRQPMPGLLFTI